jgi:hypothetical protein
MSNVDVVGYHGSYYFLPYLVHVTLHQTYHTTCVLLFDNYVIYRVGWAVYSGGFLGFIALSLDGLFRPSFEFWSAWKVAGVFTCLISSLWLAVAVTVAIG